MTSKRRRIFGRRPGTLTALCDAVPRRAEAESGKNTVKVSEGADVTGLKVVRALAGGCKALERPPATGARRRLRTDGQAPVAYRRKTSGCVPLDMVENPRVTPAVS